MSPGSTASATWPRPQGRRAHSPQRRQRPTAPIATGSGPATWTDEGGARRQSSVHAIDDEAGQQAPNHCRRGRGAHRPGRAARSECRRHERDQVRSTPTCAARPSANGADTLQKRRSAVRRPASGKRPSPTGRRHRQPDHRRARGRRGGTSPHGDRRTRRRAEHHAEDGRQSRDRRRMTIGGGGPISASPHRRCTLSATARRPTPIPSRGDPARRDRRGRDQHAAQGCPVESQR